MQCTVRHDYLDTAASTIACGPHHYKVIVSRFVVTNDLEFHMPFYIQVEGTGAALGSDERGSHVYQSAAYIASFPGSYPAFCHIVCKQKLAVVRVMPSVSCTSSVVMATPVAAVMSAMVGMYSMQQKTGEEPGNEARACIHCSMCDHMQILCILT